MEIIGITQCDKARESRERDVDMLWHDLTTTQGFTETYAMFHSAIDLLREVISCYQNGAYMATAIMCRSVIETAIWYVATREIKEFENGRIATEMDIVVLDDDKFGSVLKEAKKKYSVTGGVEAEINRIRNRGNLVAHYGSIIDKKTIRDISALVSWLSRDDAKELIKKTIKVIQHLYSQILAK